MIREERSFDWLTTRVRGLLSMPTSISTIPVKGGERPVMVHASRIANHLWPPNLDTGGGANDD